jgi:hypothetical protein
MNVPTQYPPVMDGLLYATIDMGAVEDALQRGWIVAMVSETMPVQHPNCGSLSMLLPPFPVLEAYSNQQPQMARAIYLEYLNSIDLDQTISKVLGCLRNFKRVLLYIEPDPNKEFHILDTIAEFMLNVFGLRIGMYNHPDMPAGIFASPMTNFNIADCLFRNGAISKEEYAFMIPPECVPSNASCALLLQSINFGMGSVEDVLRVTCQLLHEIRQTVTTGRPSPVMIINDKDIAKQKAQINQIVQNSKTIYGDQDKPNT